MGSIDNSVSDRSHFDVLIIGAGVSGINAAYRIHTELPDYNYAVIESRGAVGGTWDLFRYPGIRSDSDLHTFGFPWRPWSDPLSIAPGPAIRKYVEDSAAAYGIDKKILFHHRLDAADWSSDDQQWNLAVQTDTGAKTLSARFVIFSTGYYDYKTPLQTTIPGLENFKGQTIHPQFWPKDADYTGKKVVIIGSGATAITMLPVIAQKAAMVTMLQRSPTYIVSLPAVDTFGSFVRKILPSWLAFKLVRWKFLVIPFLFYQLCVAFPRFGKWLLKLRTQRQLPKNIPYDPHFSPSYGPWQQRLCASPDGDFYQALREGHADVVTDKIKTVTATGIKTESGKTLDADIIITATGLKVRFLGGCAVTVDSKPFDISEKYVWKGQMLQDMPNAVMVIGYTNASWTLGSDSTALQVTRLLKYMDLHGMAYGTARVPKGSKMNELPVMNLTSTYLQRAKSSLPRSGDIGPWRPRLNYMMDFWEKSYGSVTTDIEFTKAKKKDI